MNLSSDHSVYLTDTSVADFEDILIRVQQGIESRIYHFSHLHNTLTCIIVPDKVVEYDLYDFHDCDVTGREDGTPSDLTPGPTHVERALEEIAID